MTKKLFTDDAYVKQCTAQVTATTDQGIVLDQTIFYAMGGGQPGDTGTLEFDDQFIEVIDTRYGEGGSIVHLVAEGTELPAVGTEVTATLDWDRRYRHMRMHTCMHLLGAVLKFPVTGGSVNAQKSRLDFDMEDTVDKVAVTEKLNALINSNTDVSSVWISEAELDAQPELIRTMSVRPPRGVGDIRLLKIGDIDLQPCGGTHLKNTSEIGTATVSKVEKKGRQNRRVHVVLAP